MAGDRGPRRLGVDVSLDAAPIWCTLRNMARTPEVKVDAMNVIVSGLSAIVVLGTLKVVAIRFHGHKMAQAYLTLF